MSERRPRRGGRALGPCGAILLAAAQLAVAAKGGTEPSQSEAPLLTTSTEAPAGSLPVPHPRLDSLAPEARESVLSRRRAVEELEAAATPDRSTPDAPALDDRALATAYGELGKVYLAFEWEAAAVAALRNAADLDPGEPRWQYYLGLLAAERRDWDEAAARFATVTRLLPGEVAAWLRLGNAQLARALPGEADAAFARALEIDRGLAAAHYGRGRVALERGDDDAAIQALEAALALQPEARKIHHLLAQAYRRQGLTAEAAEHAASYAPRDVVFPEPLVAEIRVATDSAAFHVAAADRAALDGRWDFAARSYQRALELDPGETRAHQGLATAAERQGDLDRAVEHSWDAVRLSPGDPRARYQLGRLQARRGALSEAREQLEEALRFDPEAEETHLLLGSVLLASGDLDRALAAYDAVLERAPQQRRALLERAAVLRAMGRLEEAEAQLVTLQALVPDDPAVAAELTATSLQIAHALGRRGDYAGAAERYGAALARDPGNVEARLAHATALLLGGRPAAARDTLVEGLAATPGELNLMHALARLLASSQDPAVRDGQRALELALAVFQQAKTMEHAETVAMAYAVTGAYDQAERWQRTLLTEAERLGDADWAERLRANLARYERDEAP